MTSSPAADLAKRLRAIRSRVGAMPGHSSLAGVPASRDDDDLFICDTADEAAAFLEAQDRVVKAARGLVETECGIGEVYVRLSHFNALRDALSALPAADGKEEG